MYFACRFRYTYLWFEYDNIYYNITYVLGRWSIRSDCVFLRVIGIVSMPDAHDFAIKHCCNVTAAVINYNNI